MTNSNPSRFFISSTRYLGIKGEKHVWQRQGNRRDPQKHQKTWKGTRSGVLPHLPAERKGLVDALLQPSLPLRLPHEP